MFCHCQALRDCISACEFASTLAQAWAIVHQLRLWNLSNEERAMTAHNEVPMTV